MADLISSLMNPYGNQESSIMQKQGFSGGGLGPTQGLNQVYANRNLQTGLQTYGGLMQMLMMLGGGASRFAGKPGSGGAPGGSGDPEASAIPGIGYGFQPTASMDPGGTAMGQGSPAPTPYSAPISAPGYPNSPASGSGFGPADSGVNMNRMMSPGSMPNFMGGPASSRPFATQESSTPRRAGNFGPSFNTAGTANGPWFGGNMTANPWNSGGTPGMGPGMNQPSRLRRPFSGPFPNTMPQGNMMPDFSTMSGMSMPMSY